MVDAMLDLLRHEHRPTATGETVPFIGRVPAARMTAHVLVAGRRATLRTRLEEDRLSTQPGAARVVVIGAGIVGNSLVYHLARLGWTDIVQIEKGPLPNPGGSTGHASNFIFLTDHSREMTALTARGASNPSC
jgi:hypothetical protein